jgi:hypothetical protein
MRVNLFLADSAQIADGKLMVLGGGVTNVGGPVAIAGFVYVGWDETNKKHKLTVTLVDAAGQVPAAAQIKIEANFEMGRPPNVPAGSTLPMPIAVMLGPLPLAPGEYEFRVQLDDQGLPEWNIPFVSLGNNPPGGQPT